MFARIGRWCHDHRVIVAVVWFVALLGVNFASNLIGTESRSEFTLPNVESKRGFDILDQEFGGQGTGESGRIVFRAEQGVNDPAVQSSMEQFFNTLATTSPGPGLAPPTVVSPYDPSTNGRQIGGEGTDVGKIAYAQVELPPNTTFEEGKDYRSEIDKAIPRIDGLRIEIGGQIFSDFEPPQSELIGLAFAIFVLIFAFGSVLAMGLPVGVALAGIGVGTATVGILSNVVTTPDFATILGLMIGLGVGIDYALFIVTRFRENLHKGYDVRESTIIAMDTAGRAVAFAGITVVISLLGMLIMNLSFVTGLAVGAATVVAVTLVASLTLLPALLGFAGSRVEVTRWRGLIAAGLVALGLLGVAIAFAPLTFALPLAGVVLLAGFALAPLKKQVPWRHQPDHRKTAAYRWSRLIQRRPWPGLIAGAVLLIALALPILGLRLGFSDEGNFPKSSTTRQAYDLLGDGFGPGFNGPFILTTRLANGADPAALNAVHDAVAADPGVALVSPATTNNPQTPTAALWRVVPKTAPQDEATTQLVKRLRSDVLPGVDADTGLDVAVTGNTAIQVDFSDYLAHRLLWFFGAVLTLSFLLLMVVFRSLLVPLKAVVMNLLSIGAAYGIIIAVFQWGWGGGLINIDGAPIEPFMPMMLFAIVFGLSMDYEVFLLSRIKEEYDRTGDSHTSVADGLAATARVITAAAAIMVVVFGSFLLETDRTVKLFGMGLAVAIFLDATVVRMLLVPATMELLGDRNWWLPKWLARLIPQVNVEGHAEAELATTPEPPADEPERELEKV